MENQTSMKLVVSLTFFFVIAIFFQNYFLTRELRKRVLNPLVFQYESSQPDDEARKQKGYTYEVTPLDDPSNPVFVKSLQDLTTLVEKNPTTYFVMRKLK